MYVWYVKSKFFDKNDSNFKIHVLINKFIKFVQKFIDILHKKIIFRTILTCTCKRKLIALSIYPMLKIIIKTIVKT